MCGGTKVTRYTYPTSVCTRSLEILYKNKYCIIRLSESYQFFSFGNYISVVKGV